MPPVFIFIDDSPFELQVFSDCIIPASPGIEFILGSTYEQVKSRLGERYPSLFLLDLYGQDPEITSPRIMSREELSAATEPFCSLDRVYGGLELVPEGIRTNEFLKRLFHITDPWRKAFLSASRAAGQNTRYGMGNLAAVRRDYPAAAAVAYTRKSMITDAVDLLAAGIDGLDLKPDGPDDQAIHEATRAAAPALLESWSMKVTHCFNSYVQSLVVLMVRSGLGGEVYNLKNPEDLSDEARDLLGPGEMCFLQTAADWWGYSGLDPLI